MKVLKKMGLAVAALVSSAVCAVAQVPLDATNAFTTAGTDTVEGGSAILSLAIPVFIFISIVVIGLAIFRRVRGR